MTSASSMPSTSSIATEMTMMSIVLPKSRHHRLEPSTVM
jgi:hypothetical protein